MSGEWPPPGWLDLDDAPGWQRHQIGVISVLHSRNDPDDTLTVALTHSELALVVFGAMMIHDLFPECRGHTASTLRKLGELSGAQKFLPDDPEGDE